MNENTTEGGVKAGLGKIEEKLGQAAGSDDLQAKGASAQVEGQAQKVIGSAQDAVNQAAESAKAAVSRAGEQARTIYGQAQERVQGVTDTVDPFVREQPYAALGIAAAAGLLVGLLLAGRRPRVVYVKPRS